MPRPEEKQFGPWLRASQDKNQKSQLVTTEKSGETRSAGGVKKDMEQRTEGMVASIQARMSGSDIHQDETERVATLRADVEERTDTPSHVHIKIPDISHNSNFEQQIRALDAAINGNEFGYRSGSNYGKGEAYAGLGSKHAEAECKMPCNWAE